MERVSRKKEPLISIIIPVYKVEKYIKRCLDSVVNQTYKNLEIILVDDGTPDNSGKICDEYAKKDKRIKIIHKENGGVSDARNKGIEQATGKYIGFVDSDDYIDVNMYEILKNTIEKENADIASCKYVRFAEYVEFDSQKYDKKTIEYNQEEYMKKFFKIGTQECVYYPWNKLYKKSIICSDQYPKGLTSEDVVGTYKALLKAKKIVEINYPYYYYFYNKKSITGSKFSNKDLDLIKIWDIVIKISNENNQKYLEYSKINRMRIDYTLLMRMAIQLNYKEINEKYKKQYLQMLSDLKKNKSKLLKSKIPLSRKISIILICMNYKLFVNALGLVRKVK